MGPPALFPTLLFLNSNRHLNMSVGCEIATLPSIDKNIACKSSPWQVMRPRPEPMILLWVPFLFLTEPNRTERQIGSISDLQRKFLRSKLDELKSTVLWLWSVDARVDEWRCINNHLYLSLSKETLNYSTQKKLKVHEGEKIYWRLLLLRKVVGGVSEMWKMIRECGDENKAAVLCKGQRQLLNRPHISLFCTRWSDHSIHFLISFFG